MKNLFTAARHSLVLLGLIFTCNVQAMLPDSGWYWNRTESGRGFNIEIQNDLLFVSAFIYDKDGRPIWLVSGGGMSSATTYKGQLIQTSHGQCLQCRYYKPDEDSVGDIEIQFSNNYFAQTAKITITGSSAQLLPSTPSVILTSRQIFGLDLSSDTQPLMGEWILADGSMAPDFYFSDRVTIAKSKYLPGISTAIGNRTGRSGINNMALGYYVYSANLTHGLLVDSSPSYYTFYQFFFTGINRIEGWSYTFPKNGYPAGGIPFVGDRIKSAASIAGKDAPGTGLAGAPSGNLSYLDAINHQRSLSAEHQASDEVIYYATKMMKEMALARQ